MRALDLLFGRSGKPKIRRTVIDDALARVSASVAPVSSAQPTPGHVRIGRASGKLTGRGHAACPAAGTAIDLSPDTMYGGTVAIGPMGSGKTRAVLQPFAAWFLARKDAGMFGFGVKPNWSQQLVRIAKFAARADEQIHVVGPGHEAWSLLHGLPPDSVATFAKAVFQLDSKSGGDPFFINAATNSIRYAAQILHAASACVIADDLVLDVRDAAGAVVRSYRLQYDLRSIAEIMNAVQSPDMWAALTAAAATRTAELVDAGDADAAEMLADAVAGLDRMLVGKPDKTVGSVVMQISTVVEPFISSAPLRRAFCDGASGDFDLGAAIDAGHCVIVDVDLAEHDSAARLVFLLSFEQMRRHMLTRIARVGNGERLNPILFIADEYAEVASREHKKMWRVCREACVAPLIAYQLQSDLRATVGGADEADAMIAGFGTKVVFRTDDSASVKLVGDALGRAEVSRTTLTTQEGSSTNFSSPLAGGGGGSGTNDGSGTSTQDVERAVIDAQLMQSLRSDIRREVPVAQQTAEAVVITTLGAQRVADVVTVRAWDPPVPEKDI